MATASLRTLVALAFTVAVEAVPAQELDAVLDEETLALAEGYDKRLRYTPSTVLVFEREAIERTGALNLAELLERVIGVHITRNDLGSGTDQFVRGFTGSMLILHNGVEISRVLTELLAMPLVDVKRIEVVKGSHYPLYGPTAVTGTVNIVTSDVTAGELVGGVRGGSQDTAQVWTRASDRLGKVGYSVYLSDTRTRSTEGSIDGDRQSAIDEQLGTDASLTPGEGFFDTRVFDARLTLELGDRWTLHQYLNHRAFGTGVGVAQSLDPSGEERVTRYSADLSYEDTLGRGTLEARLLYNYAKAAFDDVSLFPPGAFAGLFPEGVLQAYGQSGQELFGELLYRVRLGAHTLDLGVGGSGAEVENDFDRRNYTLGTGGQVPRPIGETRDFGDTAPLFEDGYTVSTSHLILRDEWQLGDALAFNAGVRIDRSTDFGTFVNPRLGFDWVSGQYTNLSLLYGESASPPSEVQQTSNGFLTPLGNEDLEPAKTRLLELAFDHAFRTDLTLSLNLYTYAQEDRIGVVPDATVPIGLRYENLEETERGTGAELQFSWQASSRLRLAVGGAVQQLASNDLVNAGAPRFQPHLEADYASRRGWSGNVALIGVLDRDREPGDERPPIDDYAIVNLTALRRGLWLPGLDLSLSVQNVLDADAREDVSSAIPSDLPVYPRRVLLGVTYSR